MDASLPVAVDDDNAHSGMLYASTSTPAMAHLTIEELAKGAQPASKPIGLQRERAVKVRTYIDDEGAAP